MRNFIIRVWRCRSCSSTLTDEAVWPLPGLLLWQLKQREHGTEHATQKLGLR
jgi:hypothetical protein